MARIGLIDQDSHNFPNLALMKISAWHKEQGDEVEWYFNIDQRQYDKVYISKVFSWSKDYQWAMPNAKKVIRGGSGFAIKLKNGKEEYDKKADPDLPYEIEHIYPDYGIYSDLTQNKAFGYLTRGCPRRCAFCHVKDKEGTTSIKVADLSEFWSGQKNIILSDPNIFACKDWRGLFQQLKESKATINFNQGLDIRLMDEEKAEALMSIKAKKIHFAWDSIKDASIVLQNLTRWRERNGWTIVQCLHKDGVYVLTNYDSTFEEDIYRVNSLRKIGYAAYVMIYDKQHCDHKYKLLQRWCNNRHIFSQCATFEEYARWEHGRHQIRGKAKLNL